MVLFEAITTSEIGSSIADAIQSAFMDNLGAVLAVVGVLAGIGVVIKFTRKNAKV